MSNENKTAILLFTILLLKEIGNGVDEPERISALSQVHPGGQKRVFKLYSKSVQFYYQ
jgi:hypothetical protein